MTRPWLEALIIVLSHLKSYETTQTHSSMRMQKNIMNETLPAGINVSLVWSMIVGGRMFTSDIHADDFLLDAQLFLIIFKIRHLHWAVILAVWKLAKYADYDQ